MSSVHSILENADQWNKTAIILLSISIFLFARIVDTLFFYPRRGLLNQVPGPPNTSILFGNLGLMETRSPAEVFPQWRKEYGDTFKISSPFGAQTLVSYDPLALSSFFNNRNFGWVAWVRRLMNGALGSGVLTATHEEHRRQRRVLAPAFRATEVAKQTSTIRALALRVSRGLANLQKNEGSKTVEVDLYDWAHRFSFDGLGITGFGLDFNTVGQAISDSSNEELVNAFRTIFHYKHGENLAILEAKLPFLNYLPTKRNKLLRSQEKIISERIQQLIQAKREIALKENRGKILSKGESRIGSDVLSLLVEANLAEDLAPNQKFSDELVIEQATTLMAAGQDTTSGALCWIALLLVQHPECQRKLQAELRACHELEEIDSSIFTHDLLSSLSYLDAVIKEGLRLRPIGAFTSRTAFCDQTIPLSKPIKLKNGESVSSIPVRKGDKFLFPQLDHQTRPEIWGEDSLDFKPERWFDLKEEAKREKGWNGIYTFNAGFKGCLGIAIAVLELKVAVATLFHDFDFSKAEQTDQVISVRRIVTKPYVKGEGSPRLPIMITRIEK